MEYTDTETETWGVAYNKLKAYHELYAVNTFKEVMKAFEDEVGFSPTKIPQLQDISQFLRSRTGFSLRPVGGLLSARDFLNGLAFKVFFSTQVWAARRLPLWVLACMRADTRCCCPAGSLPPTVHPPPHQAAVHARARHRSRAPRTCPNVCSYVFAICLRLFCV